MKLWIASLVTLAGLVTALAATNSSWFEWGANDQNSSSSFQTNLFFQEPETQESGFQEIREFLRVHAPGKIKGATESVEIRARISEQLVSIPVKRGQWVEKGEVLAILDASNLGEELNLAKAQLELARAKKERLINGSRSSEIEAVRNDHESQLALVWSAKRSLERGISLLSKEAISERALDELRANYKSRLASAEAWRQRLKTLEQPPRQDELAAASADVRAALARVKLIEIQNTRTMVRAPLSARVLQINANPGELTGPESMEPLLVLSDTRHLHALVEVDEFDALSVQIGQRCRITCDGRRGLLAIGKVIEVEPGMKEKRYFNQNRRERTDTFGRRVWIAIQDNIELPIDLPIDAEIDLNSPLEIPQPGSNSTLNPHVAN